MREIGQKLKETREKRNLSIQDVSVAIKINSKTLQAIEEGDVDQLPAKPFLRGFVQTYSKYLDLNVDDIMRIFMEEIGSTRPKVNEASAPSETIQSTDDAHKKIDLFKKLGFVAAALIAVLLVYFIQKVVGRYEKEQQVAQTQKEAFESLATQEEAPVKTEEQKEGDAEKQDADKKLEAKGTQDKEENTTAASDTVIITPTPITETVKPAPTPAPVPLKPEVVATTPPPTVAAPKPTPAPTKVIETPKPVPTPAPAKVIETPKPVPAPVKVVEAPKPAEVAPTAKKIPQQIIVEALDNVEVRYTKDGGSEKTVRLKPEQILTIRADYKVNLNINDGGAVSIIRNGRDAGVPGNLGKSLKLNYP